MYERVRSFLLLSSRSTRSLFAYVLPNMEAAQTAPGPIIALQVVFAGFLVTTGHMGWLIFMYYISVFAYALKALALNEFTSSAYDSFIPLNETQVTA